jgi:hypothetical protein
MDDFVPFISSSSHRRLLFGGIAFVVLMAACGLLGRVTAQLDTMWMSISAVSSVNVTDADAEVEGQSVSSCAWSPSMEAHGCFPLLMSHLQASLNFSRTRYWRSRGRPIGGENAKERYLNRRWLFLGDSTVFRLFLDSRLETYVLRDAIGRYKRQRGPCLFSHRLQCHSVYCHRCDTMQQLSLNEASSGWVLPDYAHGEGPVKFGYSHPYCTDCDGCDTKLLTCSLSKSDDTHCSDEFAAPSRDASSLYTGPAYGGYISVEFARDVELQTNQFTTTQENILSLYIAERWNAPIEMIEEFGRPICVVSTGHHDIAVPNITKAIYLENVQWYLEIVSQQCDSILWVTNTGPLTDDFHQTKAATLEWNMGIKDILFTNPEYRRKSFVLDVFNASLEHPHADNIHMERDWYEALATFVRTVMDADLGWYESY